MNDALTVDRDRASEPPSAAAPVRERLPWIDVLKGIGILTIVAFHVSDGFKYPITSMYALPIFFFSNGYRMRVREDEWQYFLDKAIALLIPYVCFLVIIYMPEFLRRLDNGPITWWRVLRLLRKPLYGGASLGAATGPFWFVTVLFATQQLGHFLLKRFSGRQVAAMAVLMLGLAYLHVAIAPKLLLPWALHVVPFATPFLLLGYYSRKTGRELPLWIAIPGAIAGAVLLVMGYPIRYDMRFADYGVPVLLPLVSVCAIAVVVALAKFLGRSPTISRIMGRLGEASLVILLTHQAINLTLSDNFDVGSFWVRAIVSVAVSYAIWTGLRQHVLTRALFLGSKPDCKNLILRFQHSHAPESR